MPWHQLHVDAPIAMGVFGLWVGLLPLCSRKGSTMHRHAGRLFFTLPASYRPRP